MNKLDMREGIAAYTREHQVAQACSYRTEDEPALRAAFARTEIAKTRTFEHAMSIPAFATAIRTMAHALRQTPGELFESNQ